MFIQSKFETVWTLNSFLVKKFCSRSEDVEHCIHVSSIYALCLSEHPRVKA
jgi:hypothetical protein